MLFRYLAIVLGDAYGQAWSSFKYCKSDTIQTYLLVLSYVRKYNGSLEGSHKEPRSFPFLTQALWLTKAEIPNVCNTSPSPKHLLFKSCLVHRSFAQESSDRI